jgi:uncharacterized membrane protein (UPF0127 family)
VARTTAGRRLTGGAIAGLLLIALAGIGAAGSGGKPGISQYGNPWVWLQVGPVTVKAEAVRTPERLYLGLSHRQALPAGQGMLFFMPEKQVQVFCMRGMLLPLDLIWIDDGRVAGITPDVPPTFPGDLQSPQPVNFVLEVPGGFAAKYGIRVGDRVQWE